MTTEPWMLHAACRGMTDDWPTRYGNKDRFADDLQRVLATALARLPLIGGEETTCGGCYETSAA